MLKKSFLNILFIVLTAWIPFQEIARAASCSRCTEEQKKSCTDVNISYERDPNNDPNWKADMWYEPCQVGNEPGGPFYADNWKDNFCCVQRGSTVQIGQMGMKHSSVNQAVHGPEFNVLCRGSFGRGERSDLAPPCCRDADLPLSCTNVTVTVEPDTYWAQIMNYDRCENKCVNRAEDDNMTSNPDTFKITSGTLFEILGPGRQAVLSEKLSDPQINVRCSGTFGAPKCCIEGRANCPPKSSSKSTTKDKVKESPKTPAKKTEQNKRKS